MLNFGTAYSPAIEAAQNRKEARAYLAAMRTTHDAKLRINYRQLFRSSLQLARALERKGR